MENNQNRAERKQKLMIGTIVALLLLNSFTLYLLFSENKARIDVATEKIVLLEDFKKLTDSVAVKNSELDFFAHRNVVLSEDIISKQQMIEKQKNEIRILLSKNKLRLNELAEARLLLAKYESSIAEMTTQVEALTRQNEQLIAQNSSLSSELAKEKTSLAQLSEQNNHLAKKVETGSLLPVAKLKVDAIRHKYNGKEVTVKKAKAAESLRISFETGENKLLDAGMLDLYLCIINPKGETIAVAEQGSGVMTASENVGPLPYTRKAEIDYQQQNKKVVMYWSRNIQAPGTYKVELYQSGRVISQGAVKLS